MRFVALLEVAVFVIGAVLVVTQVVVPLWTGRALFPLRGRWRAESALAQAEERQEVARIKARTKAVGRKPRPKGGSER